MYKGKRDSMLGIVVSQDCCSLFRDNSGVEWIEVFIPPRNLSNINDRWSSIAVPPNQVCFIDDIYNEIFVNAGAVLTCLYKDWNQDGTRRVIGCEREVTEMILVRFLQYELYKRNRVQTGCYLDALWQHYLSSGLKMIEYIKRCC